MRLPFCFFTITSTSTLKISATASTKSSSSIGEIIIDSTSLTTDYAVTKGRRVVALLDAKYRDLWETKLPSSMLYQLVVYAISQRDNPQSTILYPTTNSLARESRIDVSDPVHGKKLGVVCLRPVYLNYLDELLCENTAAARRERVREAHRLVFGESYLPF